MFKFKVDFVKEDGSCDSVTISAMSLTDAASQVEKLGKGKVYETVVCDKEDFIRSTRWNTQDYIRFFLDKHDYPRFQDEFRERPLRAWMQETQGYSAEWCNKCVRGYMADGRIVFFRGEHYGAYSGVNDSLMSTLYRRYLDYLGYEAKAPVFYNGLYRGLPGEEWKPILRYDDEEEEWCIV